MHLLIMTQLKRHTKKQQLRTNSMAQILLNIKQRLQKQVKQQKQLMMLHVASNSKKFHAQKFLTKEI